MCGAGGVLSTDTSANGDDSECLLPGQPAATPTTLKLVVDACLDAVPSGEKCCSTDPGCADPSSARCRGAGCVDAPDWDVSRVTDMTRLFKDRTEFNQDISRWDTSSVTSFKETFRNASSFNQDLSGWGLSPGVDFTATFLDASAFAQPVWTWPHASSTGVFVNAFTDRSNTGTVLKLTADDGAGFDQFGYSVSIDGDTMVIGALYDDDDGTDSGSAYVFQFALTPGSCSVSAPPRNGNGNDCVFPLAHGETCTPVCDQGFTAVTASAGCVNENFVPGECRCSRGYPRSYHGNWPCSIEKRMEL